MEILKADKATAKNIVNFKLLFDGKTETDTFLPMLVYSTPRIEFDKFLIEINNFCRDKIIEDIVDYISKKKEAFVDLKIYDSDCLKYMEQELHCTINLEDEFQKTLNEYMD